MCVISGRPWWLAAGKKPRAGKRVLTVGTSCSFGKMYTSLSSRRRCRRPMTSIIGILLRGRGRFFYPSYAGAGVSQA
ncbi:DUF1611 domain-containing protein [Sodalis-like endosymbiont of Proechinophthirus fluctus]|uniref:DUF1611 domain-containing protein n=1 Tax=Sodalis-like endosymbiont of Proechinophthirus fluctus TaxID=1462730 RepID=UPI00093BD92E